MKVQPMILTEAPENKFDINFSKANTNFCLVLHHNADNSYFFVNGKQIFKIKGDSKNVNLPTQVCLGRISNGFSAIESRGASLSGNLYDLLVGYSSVDKSI